MNQDRRLAVHLPPQHIFDGRDARVRVVRPGVQHLHTGELALNDHAHVEIIRALCSPCGVTSDALDVGVRDLLRDELRKHLRVLAHSHAVADHLVPDAPLTVQRTLRNLCRRVTPRVVVADPNRRDQSLAGDHRLFELENPAVRVVVVRLVDGLPVTRHAVLAVHVHVRVVLAVVADSVQVVRAALLAAPRIAPRQLQRLGRLLKIL